MADPIKKILTEADLPLTVGSAPSTIKITTKNQWILFAQNVFNARFELAAGEGDFTYLPTGETMVEADVSKFDGFSESSPFQNSTASDLYVWINSDSDGLIEGEV